MITHEKEAHLHKVLEELHHSSGDVGGTALVTTDGFMIASTLPSGLDVETIAVITSSVLKVGEESIREFGRKQLKQIVVRGKQGFIILSGIGEKFVLMVMANQKIKPGILLVNVQETAKKILSLIS